MKMIRPQSEVLRRCHKGCSAAECRNHAFSLLEVLIALAVLGVGMLGVAVLLTGSMSNMRSSRGSATGNAILQRAIEQAQRQPWTTFTVDEDDWAAPPWYVTQSATHCSGACPPGQVIIATRQDLGSGVSEVVQDVYQVEWKHVIGADGSTAGVPANIVRVDLRVTWQDRGRSVNQNREMYTTFYKFNWDQ